jgi:hypothetical protein
VLLVTIAVFVALFPRVFAYPIVAVTIWIAIALLVKGVRLRRARRREQHELAP